MHLDGRFALKKNKTSCLENSGGCEIECRCMSHPAVVCFIFSPEEVICK